MKKFRLSLTTQIFIGLALGMLLGFIIHRYLDDNPAAKAQAIAWVRVLSRVFLSLIKVIIAPLIFSTLVVGIAGAGSFKEIGRIGLKAIIYFEIVTTLALFIGLGAVNWTKPGEGVNLPPEVSADAQEIATRAGKMTPQDHIVNIFPTSIIKSMSENDVLQIVIFSLVFAAAVAALGERGRPVIRCAEALSEVMFKFTNYVMKFAPYGVGAAMAVTVASKGIGVLWNLIQAIVTFYGALAVFIVFVLGSVALIVRLPVRRFITLVKEPMLLAFTTTSSESAFPKALENMERLGVPRRIVSFILPMGYSFNLDGSTLYLSLAAVFVAQAANVPL
ncbi:MAG: dicarboxylate/amino acid:cation symporter, partial [Blastocatellia bacterium]